MSKRKNTFTRFIEDIVDDTKDFVDDIIDRAKDLETDVRDAVKDVVDDDESDEKVSDPGVAELEAALAELTACSWPPLRRPPPPPPPAPRRPPAAPRRPEVGGRGPRPPLGATRSGPDLAPGRSGGASTNASGVDRWPSARASGTR